MEKKLTKRDLFGALLEIEQVSERTDLVEFINHELELLDKKKSSNTQTQNQKDNEILKDIIVKTLSTFDKEVSIKEIQKANAELEVLSNQKISSLITQLKNANVIERTEIKKVAYFKLV